MIFAPAVSRHVFEFDTVVSAGAETGTEPRHCTDISNLAEAGVTTRMRGRPTDSESIE
jgi:hypothetical protein